MLAACLLAACGDNWGYHPDAGSRDASAPDAGLAGITVTPTSGLETTERGGRATFTIVLDAPPTDDVTIGLVSNDTGEGTVDPASVTFGRDDWDTPQVITLTGVDDDLADGDRAYTIITGAAASGDPRYLDLDGADVEATNLDDDTPSVRVSPSVGLSTTEAGGQATFTIALGARPIDDVTIALHSSDLGEGVIDTASVRFTTLDWSTPRTVTVNGIDDDLDDGDQAYTIVTAAAASNDPGYRGLDPANVSVVNLDDDAAGVTVTPTSGLVSSEDGGFDQFTIVLDSQPSDDVTIAVASSDAGEGTVDVASVTFTAADWSTPQTITVTGVDDDLDDGDQPFAIVTGAASSIDPGYAGLAVADVTATNLDDDTDGITVTPTSGLVTGEDRSADHFTIVLDAEPTADVTIGLASNDPGEGITDLASVTFTALDWNVAQTVTVTGVDDDLDDGDQAYAIVTGAASSLDPGYANLDPADVAVTNTDDERAGIVVTLTSGLVTTEAGGTATFTIVLSSQPAADVSIALSTDDPTEGTVTPSVTFTSIDWATPQTVTVTGVDDTIGDGDVGYLVITAPAISADPGYSGLDAADVSVTNVDDDTAGITVSPASGLVTDEFGATDTFDLVLDAQPTASVTIALSSSDLTEGTVSPSTVTFTTASWSVPQTVTVRGVDDAVADGDQPFTIVTAPAASADPAYTGLDAVDVSVTNLDNDSAGVSIQPLRKRLITSENGQSSSFRVRLNVAPTSTVTCTFSSSDTTEGTVNPASITFTPGNFGNRQTVTVKGVDDAIVDGDQPYQILTNACTSTDPAYQGANPRDLNALNKDND